MAKTYNQIKKSVLGKNYDITQNNNKTEKTYAEIKDGVKKGIYNFSTIKSDLEKTIRFDTFESDLSSVGKTIEDSYNNWQTKETMSNTRLSMKSMQSRLRALKEYNQLFGDKQVANDVSKIVESYGKALDGWDALSENYGKYDNGETYTKETTMLKKLSGMTSKDIKPYLKGKKNTVAYTTVDGQNITWQSLYDQKKHKEDSDALYKVISSKDDFKKYKTVGENIENPSYEEANRGISIFGWRPFAEDVENKVEYSIDNKAFIGASGMFSPGSKTAGDIVYSTMTAQERDIYNYHLGRERAGLGKEGQADEYLNSIYGVLKDRYENQVVSGLAEYADEHPVLASGISVGQTLLQGAEYLKDSANYLKTGKIDTNHLAQASSAIRGTVSNKVDWEINNWDAFKFVYNTGMSMADSLAAMATFGTAGGAVLGLSAASQGVNDALERGLNNKSAFFSGLTSGVFEALCEKYSIGKFKTFKEAPVDGVKSIIKNVGKSMLTNASEEALTELANLTYDYFANGDLSQFKTQVRAYMSEGMPKNKATRKVALEQAAQVAEAGVSGAFMGLGFGAVSGQKAYSTSNLIGQNIKHNERVSDVFDIASASPETSLAYEAYTRYANKGINADNIKNAQLGNLWKNARMDKQNIVNNAESTSSEVLFAKEDYSKLEDYAIPNAVATLKRDVGKNLVDNGLKTGKDTEGHKIADIIARKSNGEIITSEELKTVQDSKYGAKVLNENIGAELAERVSAMEKEDADLFVRLYDGETDLDAYSNAFNLMKIYANNPESYSQEHALKNKGVLSTRQATEIYKATIMQASAFRKSNAELTARARKGERGIINDSIVNYGNNYVSGKVNWGSLNNSQKQSVVLLKGLYKALNSNITFVGKDKRFDGAYDVGTDMTYVDIYAGIDLNINTGKEAVLLTASHELTHEMEVKTPELFEMMSKIVLNSLSETTGLSKNELIANEIARLDKRHPEEGEHTEKDAISELVARSCEGMLLESKEARKMLNSLSESEQKTLVEHIKDIIQKIVDWIDDFLEKYDVRSKEAKALKEMKESYEAMAILWDKMLLEVQKVNMAAKNKESNDETVAATLTSNLNLMKNKDRRYADRTDDYTKAHDMQKVTITKKDVEAVQNIQRKSISQFTSKDIFDTEKYARKYFEEMGVKSPFFRAWFGDWRANDITPVQVVTQKSSNRGTFKNEDTKWNIQISGKVFAETKAQNSRKVKKAIPYLDYIEGIVKNAVLLDTYTIPQAKAKSNNSAMMHSLYAIVNDGKGQEVLKLFVEELNDLNSDGTILRSYQLQDIIKIPTASVRVQNNLSSITNTAGTIESVSDLFKVVKTFDKDFNYSEPSVIRNDDGTPKVLYHQTENTFTIFDTRHEGAGTRDNETPFGIFMKSSPSNIGLKGDIQMPLYVNIRKPLEADDRNQLVYKLKQMSSEFKELHEQHKGLDKQYQAKFDNATKELSNYLIEWRNKNPDASRQAIYDDVTFNKLYDTENMVLEVWEAESKKLETKTKEVITATLIQNGYDGVILKYDEGSFGKKTDTYIALDSTHVKSATNNIGTFDKASSDILYADREETSVYDLMGERDRLLKENEEFKADIERLKERLELERQVTHGNHFNQNQLGSVAGHLRNISRSNMDKVQLMRQLRDVYAYIAHNHELTWEDVFERCYNIADSMLAEAKPIKIIDDYSKQILREIRTTKISLSESQKAEAQNRFGNNWNRPFFNRVIITDKGTPIETKWQEWASMYPDIFTENINEGDMISELYDIIGSLQEASETIMEYDIEEQRRWLTREIYNQYWNVSPIRTTADRYDKKIKRLNYEHRNAMKEFREDYNERIKKQKLADDIHYKKIINQIRDRKDKEIARAKELGKQRIDKLREDAERKTRIQSITSNALSLNEYLIKNSKEKHIPEVIREPVITLLKAIDFSSKKLLKKGEPTQKDISLSKSLGKVKDMMIKATNAHEELVELYGHGLDEDIQKMVDNVYDIKDNIGDNQFVLQMMSLSDLQTLEKTIKTIKHAVNKLNKFHTINHAMGIANFAQKSIIYLDSLGKGKIYDGKRGNIKKLLNWNNALPYYVFKRYGSGGMKVYEALQDGWDKFAFNTKEIIEYSNDTYTSKEVEKWSKDVKTFKILMHASEYDMARDDYEPQYQQVQLTVPHIMSMYCLNKRDQARGHLLQGGIRVADFKNNKGDIVAQSEGVVLTEESIQTILGSLSARQIEVADKLQEFMNTVCTDWGNEVSMARFGYKAFGEENYFPIQSDKNNLAVNDETEQMNSLFKLLNMSFTKSIDENANNRIVICDIFDVFAQHTSDMAKYNSLALPVLDSFKWYNYTEKESFKDGTFRTYGVKQSIESAFGKDGKNYFTTFLRDINGSQDVSRDTFGKGFISNAKIAAVGANLRVMLLQPTSYLRASAVIDNKYLTKAFMHTPKVKRAEEHCGIALWKSMGYYDTNIQRGVEAQIKHNVTWKDKATEWSTKGAELADKVTWGYLWNACELEVRDKRKDLKVGSEEFYTEIGKRLREVIYATQVVDSTMTRSQIMRSTDGRDKMLTAFASEPTLSYNMLQDAYMGLHLDARRMGKKEAWKKNGKRMAKIVYAYTMTNALAALVESAFDAYRDNDDEEMDMVEFMKLYFKNFALDMSIGNKIPGIKELYSVLQGYSSSRLDTQWAQYLYSAVTSKKPSKVVSNVIRTFSQVFGLPFYNVYRDAIALLNKLDLFTVEDLNEMFEGFFD